MPSLKEFLQQCALLASAPIPLALIVVVMAGVIWWLVDWSDSAIFASKNAEMVSKNAQIELLERQVADWKQKTEGQTPDEAKARLDALEAHLARIEPRSLSVEQRDAIRSKIADFPSAHAYSLNIVSDMSCGDCVQYAADFKAVLMEARWRVEMPKVLAAKGGSPTGIAILTPDPSKPLPAAAVVARALTAAKIQFDLNAGSEFFSGPPGVMRPTAELLITARAKP
jgi:hypothetical protein